MLGAAVGVWLHIVGAGVAVGTSIKYVGCGDGAADGAVVTAPRAYVPAGHPDAATQEVAPIFRLPRRPAGHSSHAGAMPDGLAVEGGHGSFGHAAIALAAAWPALPSITQQHRRRSRAPKGVAPHAAVASLAPGKR